MKGFTKRDPNISILFMLGILSLLSCDSNRNHSTENLLQRDVDSVFTLIKMGRNIEDDFEKRNVYLAKALDIAETIKNDSLKTKVLSRLSLAYLRLPDSLNFKRTNRETINLAKKIDDSVGLAEAFWDLAEYYRSESVADSSYHYFLEAKKIYGDLNMENETGTMLYNMATVQSDIKDYTGSEISTIQAIEILKPLGNFMQLYNSYNNLGAITQDLKEYDRAREYYYMALDYQNRLNVKNDLDLDVKNNIGASYQKQGRYEESIPYFEEVLSNQTLLQNYPRLFALALNNFTYSKSKIDTSSNLASQFTRAIDIQQRIGDILGKSRTHYNFADYYLSRKDSVQAFEQARIALNFAEKADNNERILQTLRLLTKVNPTNSSTYNQRYITLNDSLQEEERQIRDKFARIRFETDEYIAENEVLASEKQLWTSVAFGIFLLGASAIVIFNQRAKNQKLRFQQAQQSANQEIFNLMLAQKEKEEKGKKAEQKRISEELHDGVLGRMMGSRMVLTGLNQKSDNEAEIQRQKAIDALQDVEKEIRDISHELSHAAYRKMHNFMLSLKDLLKTIESSSNMDCHLVYDDGKDWDDINGEIKINVYRIVQESLQNSVKHAQCKNATVRLELEGNIMKIEIKDDGKGFSVKRKRRGIGMRNISSRVEKIKGKWQIDSTPGKGTTLKISIPIDATRVGNYPSNTMDNPKVA